MIIGEPLRGCRFFYFLNNQIFSKSRIDTDCIYTGTFFLQSQKGAQMGNRKKREVLETALYGALEPAGIYCENPDGSCGIDLSEFVPSDVITYIEMCEQGEKEHLFNNGTSLYYNLVSLQRIFESFVFNSKVAELTVAQSNALYLLTGYRIVNQAVAKDIRKRIEEQVKVSETDILALNKYLTNNK